MADPELKLKENISGSFYVDEKCISCGVCITEAPENFSFTEDQNHAYVKKQPETENEENNCENALNACPVDAIGNNG
ncbi:MAG: ferredoxin [Halanaerobiales bacterium]